MEISVDTTIDTFYNNNSKTTILFVDEQNS